MAGSINEFKASFTKDIARPNRFDVRIPIPLTLLQYVNYAKNLTYRCEAAQLPGRTFATAEQKIGSNPTEKYPYQTTYNDIELTFIVDSDMNQKVFMDAWLEYINPTYNFNFKYKEDYSTTITINQYDVNGDLTYSINLYDAYPISMNQLDLDWSQNDSYHKLTVTFAYTYWKNNSLQAFGQELVDAGIAAIADVLGGLGGSADSAIGTFIDLLPSGIENAGSEFYTNDSPSSDGMESPSMPEDLMDWEG